jgi:site-specific recombinase XerD
MDTPQTLTREEVTKLLAELERDSVNRYVGRNRHRDHALAVFMLEAGLRVGELVQLRLSDILFYNWPVLTLIVREEIAKLHVERPIPVSPTLAREIEDCRRNLWYYHDQDPTTFCFYRSAPTTHLTTRSVEAIIRKASLAALGRPVYPHMLRHTFATNMMRVTSARIVQELLGHADLRSTQIYTHPNGDDLAAAIAAKDADERRTRP